MKKFIIIIIILSALDINASDLKVLQDLSNYASLVHNQPWSTITGTPVTYPSTTTLVDGLSNALALKENANANIQTHVTGTWMDTHGGVSQGPITVTGPGDGNAALIVNAGPTSSPYNDTVRHAQWNMTGGGTWRWGTAYGTNNGVIGWDSSIYVVGIGVGAQGSDTGIFVIDMPSSAVDLNVVNTTARTWYEETSGIIGVELKATEALYYELPIGGSEVSQEGNFWIVGILSSDPFEIPWNWVLISNRPYTLLAASQARLGTGVVLSWNTLWSASDGHAAKSEVIGAMKTSDWSSYSFLVSGLVFAQYGGLVGALTVGSAYVFGNRNTTHAVIYKLFTASKDTYVDYKSDGTLAYKTVNNGAAAPSVTANSLRLEKVVTNATDITSVTMLAPSVPFNINSSGHLDVTDAINIGTGTTTGTKIGTATTQKLGFFNATPITQPTTTGTTLGMSAGTSTTVTADATFTGNSGSAAYTISDIVNALKKLGLLAN